MHSHTTPSAPSYESISELLKQTRRLGGESVKNPDFAVEGFPRSANTFLVTALNLSWPSMSVQSHSHDSDKVAAADGSFPTVSVMRNPLDAIASYSVYLSVAQPDKARNLAKLMDVYGDIVSRAANNFNVFVIPFEQVVFDVVGTLDLLEARYGLKNRVHVEQKAIVGQTTALSKKGTGSEEVFSKKGHVPRNKHPLHADVLAELQSPVYEQALSDLTKMHDSIVRNYHREATRHSFSF